MYFSSNLQILRRRSGMTQEKLAQQLGVSRQAVSKWESAEAVPEVATMLLLAQQFSCSLDTLLMQDLSLSDETVRLVRVKGFRMARHCLISPNAFEDIQTIMRLWAERQGIHTPVVLTWGFPYLSTEQKTRFFLEGFEAACLLPDEVQPHSCPFPVTEQPECTYAVLTLPESGGRSNQSVSLGIRTILTNLQERGIRKSAKESCLPFFERRYTINGIQRVELFLQCQDTDDAESITILSY